MQVMKIDIYIILFKEIFLKCLPPKAITVIVELESGGALKLYCGLQPYSSSPKL